jgi:hypothetical protein
MRAELPQNPQIYCPILQLGLREDMIEDMRG